MIEEGKPYIRKKGDKWIIERKDKEAGKQKTKYILTLPPLETLISILAFKNNNKIASFSTHKEEEIKAQNFAYELLSEQSKKENKETPKKELTKEEIKALWEITK